MYVLMVIALLLALPLISILAQIVLTDHGALHGASYLSIVAKWEPYFGGRCALIARRTAANSSPR